MRKDDFAVIKLQGRQYIVSEGDEVSVDKLKDVNDIEYDVLLLKKGGKISVGKPKLTDVKIKFKVLSLMDKGEKIRVFKYKSKSRYRKTIGFRAQTTKFAIEKVS